MPKKVNLNCPVPGCKATAPHVNDPIVQALVREFGNPEKAARWTLAAIAELGKSLKDDMNAGRWFAVITRSRQIEELYIRALYTIFLATPGEIPHIMSDDMPNGFAARYRKVNEIIFEGRGTLDMIQPGLATGTFTAMDTVNRGAHASFSTMLMVIGLVRSPEYLDAYTSGRYEQHINTYCTFLNYLADLFKAGRDKATALSAIISMSRPKSYWIEKTKEAAAAAQGGKQARNPVAPITTLKTAFLSNGTKWRYLVVDHPAGGEVRFRVHIDEKRCADKGNMVVMRIGTQADMLAAFDSDFRSALNEGWKVCSDDRGIPAAS